MFVVTEVLSVDPKNISPTIAMIAIAMTTETAVEIAIFSFRNLQRECNDLHEIFEAS